MSSAFWPATRFKLDIGDRMPNISGPDRHGQRFSVLRAPPGPFAVLSVPAEAVGDADAALVAFDRTVQRPETVALNAVVAMVGSAEQVHGRARSLDLKVPVLADTRGQLAELFRAGRDDRPDDSRDRDGTIAIVTDPDQTIRSVIPFTDAKGFAIALERALGEADGAGARRHTHGFAPILRVPYLLSPTQCQALIAMWQHSHQPGKVGSTGSYGESVNRPATHRVCYDHFIRDNVIHDQIVSTIGPRIQEAAQRAFQFDIQCYEPFFIVGYPASEGGFFGAHRDNTHPAHVHRRFALTLNLNTGDYEGGGIWFPEFADEVYDPPAGDGVVFSCSLLHEAKVVTKGTRFILSGFMWGAAEEDMRQRNMQAAAGRRLRGAPITR